MTIGAAIPRIDEAELTTLHIRGELDALSVTELRPLLDRVVEDARRDVVVELSGLTYLRRLWSSIDGVVRLRNARVRKQLAVGIDRARLIEPSLEHRELVAALRAKRQMENSNWSR